MDNNFLISEMCLEDVSQVAEIEAQNFTLPFKEKDFEDIVRADNQKIIVIKVGEKIVAQAGIKIIFDEGEINNVAVRAGYKGLGYGRQVVSSLIEIGDAMGVNAYTLEVRKSNEKAIRIYEEFGFIVEGERKNFYERPVENALIMWRR